MDKLYYIVCEDNETTLFDGRYQGRTRGAALKFLKQSLGRKSLNGLVFTITEIPVPLIREIVAEILAGGDGTGAANVVPIKAPDPTPPAGRYDAFAETAEPGSPPAEGPAPKKRRKPAAKVGNPGHGDDLWKKVRAHWEKCGNLSEAARKFGLSPNSVKTRARRENWKGDA
ncbi:hypothetical protein [Haloferula sp. A504]|uniref:hypothetical protein n=1 Tax=Haloferula sp. A504 TaxID=3373601 RepID=UPI0031CB82B3|nr:hypothetical protein [Verrucomicrobiaceae bacterium E54]